MARKIFKALGYTLFFLLAVVVLMYLTFPMDKVRDWAEREARQKLKLDIRIADLALSGLSGLEASGVVFRFKAKRKADADAAGEAAAEASGESRTGAPEGAAAGGEGEDNGGEAEPAPTEGKKRQGPTFHRLQIDRLLADVAVWQLLFDKRLVLDLEIDLMGGEMRQVHVESEEGFRQWTAEIGSLTGLRIGAVRMLEDVLGFRVSGRLSGAIRGVEVGKNLHGSRGRVELVLADTVLREPRIAGFELEDVQLGTLTLTVALAQRSDIEALGGRGGDRSVVFHFEKVEASGGDVELRIDDLSTMSVPEAGRPLSTARLDLSGSFRLLPSFYERLKTRSERDALRQIYLASDEWKRAQGRDGEYGIRCVGPPKIDSCRPTRVAGSRGRYTPGARKRRSTAGGDDDDERSPRRSGRLRSIGDRDPDRGADDRPAARDRDDERDGPRGVDRSGRSGPRPGFIRDRPGKVIRGPAVRSPLDRTRPHVPRLGPGGDELPDEADLPEEIGEEPEIEVGPAEDVPYEPPPDEVEELVDDAYEGGGAEEEPYDEGAHEEGAVEEGEPLDDAELPE